MTKSPNAKVRLYLNNLTSSQLKLEGDVIDVHRPDNAEVILEEESLSIHQQVENIEPRCAPVGGVHSHSKSGKEQRTSCSEVPIELHTYMLQHLKKLFAWIQILQEEVRSTGGTMGVMPPT